MLRPFNTVPHVVVTPNDKIIPLLLHNCNFATNINHNVNIWPCGGCNPQVEKLWSSRSGQQKDQNLALGTEVTMGGYLLGELVDEFGLHTLPTVS